MNTKHSALSLFRVVRFWWTFYQDLSPWFSKEMMHWTIGKKWKLSHSPSRCASDNASSCSFNPDTELVGVRIPDYPFLRWAMISQFSILVMFSNLCYLHSIKSIFLKHVLQNIIWSNLIHVCSDVKYKAGIKKRQNQY